MKKIAIIFVFIFGTLQTINAQEEPEEYKATKHLTAYLALDGEYINGLDALDDNYGVGLSEAGLLFTYKPLEKLEIQTIFMYRPGQTLDLSFVSANANYKFSDAFAIKAGRFNAPVSNTNYYFFAPMNTGVALPMQLTHHAFYPQSIDGIDFNGKIKIGQNSALKYNVIAGGYFDVNHLPIGILRFHGRENAFVEEHEEGEHEHTIEQFDTETATFHYHYCSAGKLSFEAGDFLTIGASSFIGKHLMEVHEEEVAEETEEEHGHPTGIKQSFGGDIKLNFGNLTINAEYWTSNIIPDDKDHETVSFKGYYGEIAYTFNKITPFIKYEYLKSPHGELEFQRPTIGINYRPIYETILKLEYHRYMTTNIDFDAVLFSLVYSF